MFAGHADFAVEIMSAISLSSYITIAPSPTVVTTSYNDNSSYIYVHHVHVYITWWKSHRGIMNQSRMTNNCVGVITV